MQKGFSKFLVSYRRLWAAVALTFFLLSPAASWACTTIVIGKDASASGNIIFARTEDYRPTGAKRFFVYPAGYYKRGDVLRDTNGFEYTFTHDSYKFTGVPDMPVNGGELYDEHGTNEHGLAVSATNTTSLSPAVEAETMDPLVSVGIQEPILTSVLLGEARTVDEAITLAGSLVERYGASESFLFMVADQNQAWIFETVSGHRWVASRVPDDSFVIVANDMVTEHVLSDDANYRGTADVVDYAVRNNFALYDSTGQVNLAASYGKGVINEESNSYRRWRGYSLYAPSLRLEPKQATDPYPYKTFVKPDAKISVADVMRLQRDRYQNTRYDLSPSPQTFREDGREIDGGTPRPIGVVTQQEAHIYEMVKGYPAEIGARWWMATAQSEHSVYLPFYGAITDTHPYFQKEVFEEEYAPGSAFWAFQDLAFKARGNRVRYGRPIQDYWRQYELKLLDAQANIERELLDTYARDKVAARRMITDYTIATTNAALNRAALIREALIDHIFLRSGDIFQVPSDTVPYVGATPVTELQSVETAAVANALGLAPSQVSAATLGTFNQEEIGWVRAPEIEGYTTLDVSGVRFDAPVVSGNMAKVVYNAELKGNDYTKFGGTADGVRRDFAFFKVTPVAGASDDVRQLVGPEGLVSLPDAITAGMATVYGTANDATVTISYYLYDGEGEPKYANGTLAVPDGNRDGYLTDPLWAKKRGGDSPSSGGSGGGGGCSAGAGGMALLLMSAAAVSLGIRRRGF